MSSVKVVDPVLNLVLNSVRQFGLVDEGPIGQQILLLGDTFYGYRFTAREFTAIWSVTDQTLNIFDSNGKRLGSALLSVERERPVQNQGTIRMPTAEPVRRAA